MYMRCENKLVPFQGVTGDMESWESEVSLKGEMLLFRPTEFASQAQGQWVSQGLLKKDKT